MRNYENDPRTLDSLVDIRDVKVDPAQPPEERIRSYVQQVKDPYCFRVGGVKVRVAYAGKDETLNDSFCNMILLYDQKTFPEENSIKRLEKGVHPCYTRRGRNQRILRSFCGETAKFRQEWR